MRSNRLTMWIVAALLLGIASGYVVNVQFGDSSGQFAEIVELLPTAFLRLIKMIIASLISLTFGLVLVQLFAPGAVMRLPIPDHNAVANVEASALSLQGFIAHTIPTSILDAMARNEILQIVVFSVFFGTATAALGERGKIVLDALDAVAHIMLKVTGYVMMAAPLAVFGALAGTIAKQGLGIVWVYGLFIGEFYVALAVLWIVLVTLGWLIVGPSILRLMRRIREPVLLAFSTASSEAAYPKTLEELERFGISNRVASFVLPTGYSFNLDGSMMYCTFAIMFIAQVYGIELTVTQQILMVAILMLTSKGIAGVPRASLVVIAATLPQFGIPEAGLLLLIGVDQFFDMGRSATNVVGNTVATAVVAKWEGELGPDAGTKNPEMKS
jgi:Na+/H+-dicarboxylate symporter